MSRILAISPADISRIDIVNALYLRGDQTYGGIINIITKKGDFAGIDFPLSGIFINYRFLADRSRCSVIDNPSKNTPDTKNILFWEPHLKLNKENSAKISFSTSDTPGKYLVILKGVDLKGEEFRQTAVFVVQKY